MAALVGIDLAENGKQFGHLAIPHSTDISAYGNLIIPVVYIRNGAGPRSFLSAGVHGDEFEGQVALRNLCLSLEPQHIQGSVIILPMANSSAVLASSRLSTIDGLNLNRVFPGSRHGSPTQLIADAIENVLLAGCDFAFDLHSGGNSLLYCPVAVTTATGSVEDDRKRLSLLRALGLGAGMLLPADSNMGFETSTDGAMIRKNVIGVSAEFGGGGRLSSEALSICEESIRLFLAHAGSTSKSELVTTAKTCQIFDIGELGAHVFSDRCGLFCADVKVGSMVAKGDVLGKLYDYYCLEQEPTPIIATVSGKLLALRALPRVDVGDCLAQIGELSGGHYDN